MAAGPALAEACKPSKWGKDDQIGAANHVTPKQVLMAMKLMKKGESHALGIIVDPKMPAFPPRSTSLQVVTPGQHNGRDMTQDLACPSSTTMIGLNCGLVTATDRRARPSG